MQLSVRFLNDVASVNSFDSAGQAEYTLGDHQTLYFQLVDMSVDRAEHGFSPPGRRYMPAPTASLQVNFVNVDDAKRISRFATQPFPQDPSIWQVVMLPSDPMKGTVPLRLVLIEPLRTLNANLVPGLLVRIQ